MTARAGDLMTRDIYVVAPDETIGLAAALMQDKDVGSLAVSSNDKLVGMLTDRDIAVRAVALDKGPETLVSDVMSVAVKYCFDDEDVGRVVHNMAEQRIRRLPVVDRDKRLVGFLSLANIAGSGDSGDGAVVLQGVATPH